MPILAVLFLNAVIGCFQEYRAEKSARALKELTAPKALVVRDGQRFEINSQDLVPGDWIILTADSKVPADIRLFEAQGLEVDESTLTGESQAVVKDEMASIKKEVPLAERTNSCFAGTLVAKGRGQGLVTATGLKTELGLIASNVIGLSASRTPLMLRMERFTKQLSLWLGLVILILCGLFLLQGQSWEDTLLLGVALAVDAIPEGLPVALTVALAVASKIMAGQKVIARRLSAVESLGSCDYICTDKTGTLTVNEQTAARVWLPGKKSLLKVTGVGITPEGEVIAEDENYEKSKTLGLVGVLCNEGQLYPR